SASSGGCMAWLSWLSGGAPDNASGQRKRRGSVRRLAPVLALAGPARECKASYRGPCQICASRRIVRLHVTTRVGISRRGGPTTLGGAVRFGRPALLRHRNSRPLADLPQGASAAPLS